MYAEGPNMAIQGPKYGCWETTPLPQTDIVVLDVADDFFGGKGEGDDMWSVL